MKAFLLSPVEQLSEDQRKNLLSLLFDAVGVTLGIFDVVSDYLFYFSLQNDENIPISIKTSILVFAIIGTIMQFGIFIYRLVCKGPITFSGPLSSPIFVVDETFHFRVGRS
jgi:hypothetical protein